MDYGQSVNNDKQSVFLKPEDNSNLENVGNEAQLTPDNFQADPNVPIERDSREIGNKVISTPGETSEVNQLPNIPNVAEMGQVVNIEMPPGVEEKETNNETKIIQDSLLLDRKNLKLRGDTLGKDGLRVAKRAEEDFYKNGDVAEFNEKIRGDGGVSESFNTENYGDNAIWKGVKET